MKNAFKRGKGVKLPQPRTEAQEFGKAKKGVLMCPTCHSFYYQKAWRHTVQGFLEKREGKHLALSFEACPACTMIHNHTYEGYLAIHNVPERFRAELMNLVKNFCERAFLRDPMDRLIGITEESGVFIITTTENQLAVKLAKKIKDTFPKVEMQATYSKGTSDLVHVELQFAE